jgi:hypothetical protein
MLSIAVDDSHGHRRTRRLPNVREELQLVFNVLRRKQRAVGQLADVLCAVDDLEVAAVIEEAGVAGVHETIFREWCRRCFSGSL